MREFLYFMDQGKVMIGDLSQIAESKRTVDVKFNDLANSNKLKLALNIYPAHDDNTRAFAFFLACFGTADKINDKETRLNTNPTLRILCLNDTILENIKDITLKLNQKVNL